MQEGKRCAHSWARQALEHRGSHSPAAQALSAAPGLCPAPGLTPCASAQVGQHNPCLTLYCPGMSSCKGLMQAHSISEPACCRLEDLAEEDTVPDSACGPDDTGSKQRHSLSAALGRLSLLVRRPHTMHAAARASAD